MAVDGWIDIPRERIEGWVKQLREGAEAEGGGPAALAADDVANELEVRLGD